MKKGIVMEKYPTYLIVMTNDGLFEKAELINGASIGEEVYYESLQRNRRKIFSLPQIRLVAMACVLLLAFIPLLLISQQPKTYAYVNVDINPSIQLEIDKNLRVFSVTPLNDDAIEILSDLDTVKGQTIDQALTDIMLKSEEKGLLSFGKNMLVGINYLGTTIDQSVSDFIKQSFKEKIDDWEVTTIIIPTEVRELAEQEHKSMNEVMASKLVEGEISEPVEDSQSLVIEEKEEMVLKSFYQEKYSSKKDRSTSEKPNKVNNKNHKKGKYKDENHPSNVKGKNGKINSQKGSDHPSHKKADNAKKNGKHKPNHKQENKSKKDPSKNKKQKDVNKGNGQPPNHSKDKGPSKKGNNHPSKWKKNNGKSNGKNNGNNKK